MTDGGEHTLVIAVEGEPNNLNPISATSPDQPQQPRRNASGSSDSVCSPAARRVRLRPGVPGADGESGQGHAGIALSGRGLRRGRRRSGGLVQVQDQLVGLARPSTPRKTDQLVLLQLCKADQETITTLEELRQEASQRGWWSTARLPSWLAAYVGLEDEAERLRVWALGIIPGLLQTPSYARLLHAQRDQLPADELDKRVDARMRRQARLDGDRPMQLTAVLAEAALRHCAHERSLAREQFHHLLARARQPNIELYVLPLEAGISVGLSGAFTLLDFPDHL
ncbi:MAG: DUF5753 domain-containing protein, partial [Pseudonocardiales bacterium]